MSIPASPRRAHEVWCGHRWILPRRSMPLLASWRRGGPSRQWPWQRVDVSLLESSVRWLVNVANSYLISARPQRFGNRMPHRAVQTFRAANGHVASALAMTPIRRLCGSWAYRSWCAKALRNELRTVHTGELVPLLQERFAQHTVGHWTGRLLGEGLPCGPISA